MGAKQPSELCTTKSPVKELEFGQLRRMAQLNSENLEDGFERKWKFLTPAGEYNMLAYLFSDQCKEPFASYRYAGFDRSVVVDNREHGKRCLGMAVSDAQRVLEDDNRVRMPKGVILPGAGKLMEPAALRAAAVFAAVCNDWLLGNSPVIELFCDRLDVHVFGDATEWLTTEDGFRRETFGPFPEVAEVLRRLRLVGESGLDLGAVLDAYGEEAFDVTPYSCALSLPLSVNTLYTGKTGQSLVNRHVGLANLIGDHEMSVAQMMRITDEAFYETFVTNYLQPALDAGLVEPVGHGDSRSQKYRCVRREE